MLFNSWAFALVFLPCVLLVYQLLAISGHSRFLIPLLTLASLFFYGWDNPNHLLLILGSAVFNFVLGSAIHASSGRKQLWFLTGGLMGNLGLLGCFKYAGFFGQTINNVLRTDWPVLKVVLPIGISFYTFQQIAYLIDCRRGVAKQGTFMEYVLFVTYFPQLIAGPIVHYREIAPQLKTLSHIRPEYLAPALTLFAIGLFKKVGLADSVAPYADQVFNRVADGYIPDFVEAWSGALSFTFQLYFDFSGYADMAIGLGLMFGVFLPVNFNSPYKAHCIIDFWRRWHITLSHFLRDYLYTPLGGNRHGLWRTFANLLLVMFLGGLWHGAGWTFVVWGGLHGFYLLVNHGWRAVKHLKWIYIPGPELLKHGFSVIFTFLAVVVAWVFFRANNLETAWCMVSAMFELSSVPLHQPLGEAMMNPSWKWIGLLAVLSFILPNTQQVTGYQEPAGVDKRVMMALRWQPTASWAIVSAVLTFIGLYLAQRPSPFLYFQF